MAFKMKGWSPMKDTPHTTTEQHAAHDDKEVIQSSRTLSRQEQIERNLRTPEKGWFWSVWESGPKKGEHFYNRPLGEGEQAE